MIVTETSSVTPPRPALPSTLPRREMLQIELGWAIEGAAYPSELLNRLQAAATLNQHALGEMRALFSAAPTLYQVVREQLLQALGRDPDSLSWIGPLQQDAPLTITLTQLAIESLREGFHVVDPNQNARLVDDEGTVAAPALLSPEQLLARLDSLHLKDRYNTCVRDYWQGIAHGQSVSCGEYAGELRRVLIKTQALVAQAAGQLSAAGLEMWLQVVDAPTEQERLGAGGEADDLQVSEIAWANDHRSGNGAGVVFKGAFVIHGRDAGQNPRELLFVPGMDIELFEFDSRAQLLAQLVRWIDSGEEPGWLLWQLLPYHSRSTLYASSTRRPLDDLDYQVVAEDIFQRSARASIYTQHANELISAVMVSPALQTGEPVLMVQDASGVALSYAQTTELWRHKVAGQGVATDSMEVVADFIRRDARWHEDDIAFGSLAPELALRHRQEKLALQEYSILQLLRPDQLSADTPSFSSFVAQMKALEDQRLLSLTCLKDLAQEANLEHADWLTTGLGQGSPQRRLIASRSLALLIEGKLQVLQNQMTEADSTRLTQALKLNIAGPQSTTDLRLVSIAAGTAQQPFTLIGSFVITSRQALLTPALDESALLFVPGQDGGLISFRSLAQLQEHVGKTLARRSDCSLWLTVALEQQAPARAWVKAQPVLAPMTLQLSEITIGIIEYSVKAQIKAHKKSLQAIKKNLLVFPGADRQTALALLAQTTAMVLRVPEHTAREQAFTHIDLQRRAQALKQKLAPWLSAATHEVQVEYVRRSRQINENVQAIEGYLFRQLPSIIEFAAGLLREQFQHDGFGDELDPLEDMFSIPDEVWVIKTIGTPHMQSPGNIVPEIELAQVPLRLKNYNMVQLALENMDPEDPETALRLKHLKVLDPKWNSRLSVEYLNRIMPALDISGAYEHRVNQVFHGGLASGPDRLKDAPGNDVLSQLMTRPYRQALELEAWMARQLGMDEAGLMLFSHAIKARKAADLKTGGMDIELGRVEFGSVVERYGGTLVEGGRVIHDRLSDRTLIYLADAPGGHAMVMYPRLEQAKTALADMSNKPELLDYLAHRTEPGEQWQEAKKRIAEGATNAPADWLGVRFTEDVDMALTLSNARPDRLIQVLHLTSWSNARRDIVRSERHERQVINNIAIGFSFVPGLNLLSDLYFIIQAAKAIPHARSAYEVAQQVLQIGMCVADIIITLVTFGLDKPQISAGERLPPLDHEPTMLALQAFKVRQTLAHEGWAARAIESEPKPFVAPDFSRYEVDMNPQGACALSGKYDAGSYRKEGVQFVLQKSKCIRVTRPKNAQALHLQHPQTGRLGPPIHLTEAGEWYFAAGYGLPGGMKTAQAILMDCGMSLEVAQGLLADYDFPVNSGLDQLFALSVQRDSIRPEWANRFRAVTGDPMAGSSSRPPVASQAAASQPVAPELQGYVIRPLATPAVISSGLSMDRVVIGEHDLFVGQLTDSDGFYQLFWPDPNLPVQLQRCGRLSPAGIYHLETPVERDFISIDGHFYEVRFDQRLYRFTLIKPGGGPQTVLLVEPTEVSRRMGQWRLIPVPVTVINQSARLFNLGRQLMPLPATDVQVSRFISRYGLQVIKCTVPELRLARSVAEQETLTSQYVYRHGMPVEALLRIFEARAAGLPIPDGMPIYDELQGLTPVPVSTGNSYKIDTEVAAGNYLTIGELSPSELGLQSRLQIILSAQARVAVATLSVMNDLLRSILSRKGYVFLGVGTENLLKKGYFSQIFKGPNGEVYVMTTKLTARQGMTSMLKPIMMGEGRFGVYFSDAWVDKVIAQQLIDFPSTYLTRVIRLAHERGRLFRVLVMVSRSGEFWISRMQTPRN